MPYNQNFYWMSELEYHNFHVNNNFKLLFLAAYFALMPIVLFLDFIMIHCFSTTFKPYLFLSEKIAQKFFFSGPLVLFTLFSVPFGVYCLLELRFYNFNNDF
jgi:hypothetical protein